LALSTVYALLGDELWQRVSALFGRAALGVADGAADWRLRSMDADVSRSQEMFEELLARRRALEAQVQALEEQRADLADHLRQDDELLQAVLQVLAGKANFADAGVSRPEAERDAVEVLRRVQARRAGLRECEAALAHLSRARDALDRKVADARAALQHRADDLRRRQVSFSGRQAYSQGLEAARKLEDAERDWDYQAPSLPNP